MITTNSNRSGCLDFFHTTNFWWLELKQMQRY